MNIIIIDFYIFPESKKTEQKSAKMPAQNTLQNANPHDHVELKNLAIVDPIGKFDSLQTTDSFNVKNTSCSDLF